jgi:hypothetical protein
MPSVGNKAFHATLDDAPGGATAVLIVGFSNQQWSGLNLPLDLTGIGMPGCHLYVSVDQCRYATVSGSGPGQGRATVTLPVPGDNRFRGGRVFVQWWVGNPGPVLIPGVVSAALEVTIQ